MSRRNPRQGLFTGYWTDPHGRRIRRIQRQEYGDLYRLWQKHADIRTGAEPMVWQGVKPLGQRSVLHDA